MVNMDKKFEDCIELEDGWEILSDDGFHPVRKVFKTVEYETWIVKTESFELHCADDHILFLESRKEIYAKDLKCGDRIITENGIESVISCEKDGTKENMYDVEVDSEAHSYFGSGLLCHNTTISVIFLTWLVLFHSDKACAVLANKGSQAREIMSRIQLAYTFLPKWMQVGVVSWNKGSIELENGSKIIASATSSDAVRGQSYYCVFLDECLSGDSVVTVRDKLTGNGKDVTLAELYEEME